MKAPGPSTTHSARRVARGSSPTPSFAAKSRLSAVAVRLPRDPLAPRSVSVARRRDRLARGSNPPRPAPVEHLPQPRLTQCHALGAADSLAVATLLDGSCRHDQHPLRGAYAELSQRSGDRSRLIGRVGVAHGIVHPGDRRISFRTARLSPPLWKREANWPVKCPSTGRTGRHFAAYARAARPCNRTITVSDCRLCARSILAIVEHMLVLVNARAPKHMQIRLNSPVTAH